MAAIHAANMAKLKREQVGTQITQFDDSKVMNHWRRNRKSAVDLLELPVAIDRQLEDQRIQQEFNRNPRFHIPTKVDKVRSEQIIAKQGSSRDVGIKANVVNKFVREASGIHTYALVAPVRLKGERIPIDPDPETNPFVKTYAKETKKKPHIVSFGHRPSSASRTFNPGTMKIRMKHNEVAKAPVEGKFEFGLPVGILGKLLHAPKIFQPEKEEANMLADPDNYNYDDASGAGSRDQSRGESRNDYNESAHNVHDPHDLFSAPPPSPGDVNYNNTNGNGAKAGAKTGSQKNGSIPIRKAANTGPMGDSFLGDSSLGAACVNDEHRGGYAQDIGLEGTQSWVSGSPGGGEGGRERSEGLFQGGIGNMDYMNIRIPGFPLGGSLEKPKRKKQPHPHDHLTPIKLARPQWEDAHHIISPLTRQKEVYALKANYMNDQQLNLQERLARYNAKALADEKTSFCSGKQELDMDILRGKQPAEIQKLASPVKGQPVFFDPLNSQLDMVKKRRQEMDAENNYKWKMQDFQQSIAEIPKVAYHPATLLTQLQMGRTSLKQISRLAKVKADVWKDEDFYSQDESEMERYTSKEEGGASSSPISHAQSNKISSPQYDNSGNVLPEASLQLAMLKAKSGDTRALFNLFMVHDPNISNSQRAQQFDMLAAGSMDSLANSDFNYVGGDGNGNEGSGSAIENQNVGQVQQQIDFAQVSDQDFALTAKEQAQALALARSQSPITAGDIPILATGKGVIRSSPSSKHGSIANKPNSAPTATAISKSGSLVKTPPKASTTKDVAFKKNDTEAGFRAGTEAKPKLSKLEAALLVQKEKDMVNVEENDTVIAENGTFDLQAVVPIIANPLDGVDPAITEAFFNEAANIGFTSLSLDDDASTGSLDKEESRSTRTRQIY